MAEESDNMVLRTLYLPRELDEQLKSAAIRGARSKGDVIRELIHAGLVVKRKERKSYLAEPPKAVKPVRPKAVKHTILAKKAITAKPKRAPAKARAG